MDKIKIAFIILIVILGGALLTAFDVNTVGIGIALMLAIAAWIIEER